MGVLARRPGSAVLSAADAPWLILGWSVLAALALVYLGGISQLWWDAVKERHGGGSVPRFVVVTLLALLWPFAFGPVAIEWIKQNAP